MSVRLGIGGLRQAKRARSGTARSRPCSRTARGGIVVEPRVYTRRRRLKGRARAWLAKAWSRGGVSGPVFGPSLVAIGMMPPRSPHAGRRQPGTSSCLWEAERRCRATVRARCRRRLRRVEGPSPSAAASLRRRRGRRSPCSSRGARGCDGCRAPRAWVLRGRRRDRLSARSEAGVERGDGAVDRQVEHPEGDQGGGRELDGDVRQRLRAAQHLAAEMTETQARASTAGMANR